MYNLICMSFDGDYITERGFDHKGFNTIADAWDYSNDLGSKWFFYPFHFVTTDKTIADSPDQLGQFIHKRISTVKKQFAIASKLPEAQNMDCDSYVYILRDLVTA